MGRIRLQTELLFFSKLLFHLMNVNEGVGGGWGVIYSQRLNAGSLPLPDNAPLFVFMWRWRDVYAYSYRASHPAP